MNTLSIAPDSNRTTVSCNPWGQVELPLGPPMSQDSPWVKSLVQMFPRENPDHLSKSAPQLLSNMMRMFSSQIARELKRARETARKMKEAL